MTRRLTTSVVGGLLAVSLLAACSSSDGAGGDATAAGGDAGAPAGDPSAPADLDFWSWATNVDQVTAIWNEQNPEQQVTVDSQAQGDELVTRVITAAQAGEAPCLLQTEYQALPTLVANGVVADITADVEGIRDEFPEAAWGLTSFGEQTFAIPQDVAPMMLFYREDLFDELGLEPPTTWDEYAELAAQVREADPSKYLTTFSAGDPGWFAGLSQQAGAEWWGLEGEAWSVGIDAEPTQQVAEYWGGLVEQDLIDDQPMYTPEWNAAMNDGTLLSWPTAVWGAGVLEGVAPDTAGLWRAVPMPTWDGGEAVTGYWGGSATAISADCEDKAQAIAYASWLNTDPEAVEAMITIGGLYPASTAGQTSDALAEPPVMMPNQPEFYELAAEVSGSAQGFTFGPNVNVAYTTYVDAFQSAVESGAPFTDALTTMQETTLADLGQQGYEVAP